MSDETFLTTAEVLDYLRIELRTVYRMIKAGQIPAVRVGRQWRFRKSDLDAWLERRGTTLYKSAAQQPEGTAARTRQWILVVDDEAGVREILLKSLTLAEYQVDVASSGRAALEQLRASNYDLLIIDLNLPDVDGLTVARDAKRLYPAMKVIIVTGNSTEAAAIDAINLGVSGYLTKPFRIPRVITIVAKLLGE